MSQVDNYLEKDAKSRTDPGWFHPSDMGHTCDAYLAFGFLGVPKQEHISANLQRIFDNGKGRDLFWKEYLQKSGLSIFKEDLPRQPCEKCGSRYVDPHRHVCLQDYAIRGECDDVVENPFTHEREVVEIKTIHADAWKELKGPKPDHKIQSYPYMVGHNTGSTLFVYENKNTQEVKIPRERFDVKVWKGITDRLEKIVSDIENNWLPQRTPQQNEKSCPYYYMCPIANIAKLKEEAGLV